MTVKDLIKVLAVLPQDAIVYTEGCDCYGTTASVKLESDGTVLIERDGERF